MQPLYDLTGRVLSVDGNLPTQQILDGLLRMQNSPNWTKPITLYLGVSDQAQQPGLGPIEAVQICTMMRSIRSPVRTIAIGGLLKGYEPLLLAAGTRGQRYLLRHTILWPSAALPNQLPVPGPAPGLGQDSGSLQQELYRIHLDQLASLCTEVSIPCRWEKKILTAEAAITQGYADVLITSKIALPKMELDEARIHLSQTELSLEYQR